MQTDRCAFAFFRGAAQRARVSNKTMHSSDTKDFHATTRDAKKVMVVDLGFLGDTVHLVPALWEIKDHYPQAELHVLSSPVGCEVLKLAKCVDRAWSFPLGPPSPSWWEHWDVLRAMRRERFDVAFNFSGADRTVFVTVLLRARHAIVYQGGRKHFWQPWLVRYWIPRAKLPMPVFVGRREILKLCGFNLKPARFDLTVPEEARRWAQEKIPAGSVHVSLNASFALKEWPITNNIEMVRQLLTGNLDRRLIVSGAPNPREQARLEKLRREINDPRLMIIDERLGIARLAAMLERCAVHVGPDSGVIHLAAALNVPTVAIFRRYHDMAEFLPIGPQHIYFDTPCSCMGVKNPPCEAAAEAKCLGGIAPKLVANAIRRQLTSGITSMK